MTKRSPRSRAEWLEAAAKTMAREGVEGVRVEVLARALGVTKGSFYWHFVDRQALLSALVQVWAEEGTAAVIHEVEAGGGDPAMRIRRLWEVAHASGDLAFELALREWGRRDAAVAEAIREVDDRRMAYLRQLFGALGLPAGQAEARCMLMYSLLIGDWFIDVSHGRRSRKRVLSDALDHLLTR